MRPYEKRPYEKSGREPRIDEMLRDPIVQTLMRRDGVSTQQISAVLEAARSRLDVEADRDWTPAGARAWRCPEWDCAALSCA